MAIHETGSHEHEHVRRFFLEVVRSLVDDREPISIEVLSGDTFSTVRVRGTPAAVAILIGPKGQMARALRTILAGYGAKISRRYSLDLGEA